MQYSPSALVHYLEKRTQAERDYQIQNVRPTTLQIFGPSDASEFHWGGNTYNFLKIGRPPQLSESKFKQEPNLFLAPLTLHFRCKEFRKSTFLMFAKIDAKLSLPPKCLKFLGHNHRTLFDPKF